MVEEGSSFGGAEAAVNYLYYHKTLSDCMDVVVDSVEVPYRKNDALGLASSDTYAEVEGDDNAGRHLSPSCRMTVAEHALYYFESLRML